MRELKFRGKVIDDCEWVIGSFVNLDHHNSVEDIQSSQIVLLNGHAYEVGP